jgi:hypothetical protein
MARFARRPDHGSSSARCKGTSRSRATRSFHLLLHYRTEQSSLLASVFIDGLDGLSSVCVRRCISLYRSQPSLAACFSSVLDAVAGLISGVKRGNKAVLHSLFMTSSMCQILVPGCLRILQCMQRVTGSRRLVRIFRMSTPLVITLKAETIKLRAFLLVKK